jgi:hypothetical protein
MKKNLFAIIASASFAILTFTNAAAQQFNNGDVARINYTVNSAATESKSTAAMSSKAGSKAYKNFSKQFKAIDNADWFVTEDAGFVANFTSKASPTRVYYNSKGQFEYSITRHSAANTPSSITRNVKFAFDGYRVICSEEIVVEGKTVYLVHIQSFTSSKTIRIENGEMEVIEDLMHY